MLNQYSGFYNMHPAVLNRWAELISGRIATGKDPMPSQYAAAIALRQERKALGSKQYIQNEVYQAKAVGRNGVAVLDIKGELSRDGNCNAGYEDMVSILSALYADADVKSILLNINSPGGNCDGLPEAADAIKARNKPVVAYGGFVASAAYFLASQADEFWLADQAASEAGSIGTLMVLIDQREALQKQGYVVKIVRAEGSEEKALINGFEEIPAEAMAAEMQMLNACRREFVGYVRRGRAGKLTSEEWKTGKMFNSKDAIRIGLADRVGSLNEAIAYAARYK